MLAYAPRTNRNAIQVVGLLAVVGVCLVAVVVPTFLALSLPVLGPGIPVARRRGRPRGQAAAQETDGDRRHRDR